MALVNMLIYKPDFALEIWKDSLIFYRYTLTWFCQISGNITFNFSAKFRVLIFYLLISKINVNCEQSQKVVGFSFLCFVLFCCWSLQCLLYVSKDTEDICILWGYKYLRILRKCNSHNYTWNKTDSCFLVISENNFDQWWDVHYMWPKAMRKMEGWWFLLVTIKFSFVFCSEHIFLPASQAMLANK